MFLMIYFAFVNSMLFVLMGIDKKRAVKNQWRIPERNLLLLGLAGGGLGGMLGMKKYRHKTRETKFKVVYFIGTCILMTGIVLVNQA